MNFSSFLMITLALFAFYTMTNGQAFAQRETGPYSQISDKAWDMNSVEGFVNSYLKNVQLSLQNVRHQLGGTPVDQDDSKQMTADILIKEQEGINAQQIKLQDQAIQLDNLRDQQERQKQRQQDMMQDLSEVFQR